MIIYCILGTIVTYIYYKLVIQHRLKHSKSFVDILGYIGLSFLWPFMLIIMAIFLWSEYIEVKKPEDYLEEK